MGKNKVSLTTEQQNCIDHKKGNLIVSAAAGSGKTHVIIERIIRLVKDEHVSVNKILAVTFTRLAADEMKEKLKKALIAEFNETGDLYFKEQLNSVSSADISTIHSFLVNVLRSYFYKLQIDANFEVADERKSKKLMNSAISDIFEEIYEEGDERVIEIVSYYSSNRKDDSFKKTIMALYNFCNSEKSIEDIRQKSLKFSEEAFQESKENNALENGYNEDSEQKVKNTINVLLDLTLKLKERYNEYKREENVLDFADLEFLSIELFKNEEILNDIKNKYEYIFVDEYQDVNAVQEEIVQKLSSDNAFMVGDSKQSIYGFRGCDPSYFIDKNNKYANNDGGKAIPLNKNFRSAKNIVDAVNNVFSNIMTEEFGGTNYSNNQMVYGEGYGDYQGKAVIKCVKEDREKEKQTFSGVYSVVENSNGVKKQFFTAEMLAIVDTIKKVYKSSYYDVKSNSYKQVEYDDICILTRSLKGYGEEIVKVLTYYDIPVSSSVKSGVAEYPEIKALHSAVKALSFMQSDVDLATVMLNFGGFDEDELVKIRKIGGYRASFYNAIKKTSFLKDDLGCKTEKFITWFNVVRLYAEYMPASVVLRKIINDSSWDLKLMATTFGKSKKARVERFLSEADFTSKPMKVNEFKEYLDEFIEDVSFSEADGEGTVKLMTAHASKGLEFPIVISVGLSKNFSSQDKRNQVLMDRNFGITPKSYNSESMTVTETPAIKILKESYNKKRAIEEIRLFYVQLTRAKCELYLIVDGDIYDVHDIENIKDAKKQKDFLAQTDMEVENLLGSELEANLKKVDGVVFVAGNYENEKAVEIIKQNLSFNYAYQKATEISLKTSVSKLNSKDKEYYNIVETFGDSSSEKGTAYHRFLELSSFDVDKVEEELQNFLDLSLISKEEYDLLDANKLKSILNIPIFNEIKDKKLYKERKFCNFINAKDVGYDIDERILVQGIIDLIVEDENGITLIDYKLSKIEEDKDIINKYNKQLLLYKKAIENCMDVKVNKVYIINILQEKIIELTGI